MSEETGSQQELEIASGDKKIKLRGSDLLTAVIGIVVCSGLTLLGYTLYEHKGDARDHGKAVVDAVKEMSAVAREGVIAQREMNCLISQDQNQREKQAEYCKRMAR
jgi:hypothetical protein